MIAEITEALRSLAGDESIAVNIIKAAGKHFCAGHDLAEMTGGRVKENKEIFDRCTRMMHLLHQLPQPVISRVQGIATAARYQMVAWSDLAVAEEGARFPTPGVRIGLFCTTPRAAISRVSRYVVALGKQGFYARVDQTDEAAFDYATSTIALNLGAEDAQIRIRAILDK